MSSSMRGGERGAADVGRATGRSAGAREIRGEVVAAQLEVEQRRGADRSACGTDRRRSSTTVSRRGQVGDRYAREKEGARADMGQAGSAVRSTSPMVRPARGSLLTGGSRVALTYLADGDRRAAAGPPSGSRRSARSSRAERARAARPPASPPAPGCSSRGCSSTGSYFQGLLFQGFVLPGVGLPRRPDCEELGASWRRTRLTEGAHGTRRGSMRGVTRAGPAP